MSPSFSFCFFFFLPSQWHRELRTGQFGNVRMSLKSRPDQQETHAPTENKHPRGGLPPYRGSAKWTMGPWPWDTMRYDEGVHVQPHVSVFPSFRFVFMCGWAKIICWLQFADKRNEPNEIMAMRAVRISLSLERTGWAGDWRRSRFGVRCS